MVWRTIIIVIDDRDQSWIGQDHVVQESKSREFRHYFVLSGISSFEKLPCPIPAVKTDPAVGY